MRRLAGLRRGIGLLLLASVFLFCTACQGEENLTDGVAGTRQNTITRDEGKVSIAVSKYVEQARDANARVTMQAIKSILEVQFVIWTNSAAEEDKKIITLVKQNYCNHVVPLSDIFSSENVFSKEVQRLLQENGFTGEDVSDLAIKVYHRKKQSDGDMEYQVTVLQENEK